MRATLAALLLLLGLASSAAIAELPCDVNKAPHGIGGGKIRQVSNTYNAGLKATEITLEWDSPTASNKALGCFTEWVVERSIGGKDVAFITVPANPRVTPVRATMRVVPGQTYSFTVWARNGSGKTSLKIGSGPVVAVSQGSIQPRGL